MGKLNDEAFQLVEVVDYDTYGNALSRPAVADVTTKSHARFLDVVSRRVFERLVHDFPKLRRLHAEHGVVPPMAMLAAGEHWVRRPQRKTSA